MTPEGRIKYEVKKLLKARGVWYFMPVQNGMGRVGIPDFVCCVPPYGRLLAVETKAPGKKDSITPNQQREISSIRSATGWAYIIDDPVDLIPVLDLLMTQHV